MGDDGACQEPESAGIPSDRVGFKFTLAHRCYVRAEARKVAGASLLEAG
jgi:hypothetical protein